MEIRADAPQWRTCRSGDERPHQLHSCVNRRWRSIHTAQSGSSQSARPTTAIALTLGGGGEIGPLIQIRDVNTIRLQNAQWPIRSRGVKALWYASTATINSAPS